MSNISTQNLEHLPDIPTLKRLCKALATLDAIICREWEYRYYSYDKNWDTSKAEECFSMRDGSGDEFQILFSGSGCAINGFAHESEMNTWSEKTVEPKSLKEKITTIFKKRTVVEQRIWKGVVDDLPEEFYEFMFGEPVKSTGTTFCIWRKAADKKWNRGNIEFPSNSYGDGSEDLLYILDNDPGTYRNWAKEYYEEQFEKCDLDLETIKQVYNHHPIDRRLVQRLNPTTEDFEGLKKDLDEIGYEYIDL